jgi:hypothetical protein
MTQHFAQQQHCLQYMYACFSLLPDSVLHNTATVIACSQLSYCTVKAAAVKIGYFCSANSLFLQ